LQLTVIRPVKAVGRITCIVLVQMQLRHYYLLRHWDLENERLKCRREKFDERLQLEMKYRLRRDKLECQLPLFGPQLPEWLKKRAYEALSATRSAVSWAMSRIWSRDMAFLSLICILGLLGGWYIIYFVYENQLSNGTT